MSERKIASAPTVEGLEKLLQEYFYSPSVHIDGDRAFNSKGEITSVRIVRKAKRVFAMQEIPTL